MTQRVATAPRLQLRSREARFAELVRAHRDRAFRLAWRLLDGDEAGAEDVVQDALLRAWRALPRFREEAGLATWLHRIVVRQAANHRRWRAVRQRFGSAEDPDAQGREAATGDPVLRRRIRAALAQLSRRQRESFVLVHLEGLTLREAAEILGRSEGTLKSHLHRARLALRRELADLAPAEGGGA